MVAPTGIEHRPMSSQRARRQLGQHFLHDPGILRRMVDTIHPIPGQNVIEIGPGLGALTRPLLERLGKLIAIEIDPHLLAPLTHRCVGAGALEVIQGDALQVDFARLREGPGALRLVGNLPYNISTPLLFHVTQFASHIQDFHFLLQKEVVERMAARAGQSSYGRLSVMIQYRCRIEPLFNVPPGAFRPIPKVTSSFVRMLPVRPHGAERTEPRLAAVVSRAFMQRRKTLRNALRGLATEEVIEAAGIDPSARAETIDLDGYLRLAEAVAK